MAQSKAELYLVDQIPSLSSLKPFTSMKLLLIHPDAAKKRIRLKTKIFQRIFLSQYKLSLHLIYGDSVTSRDEQRLSFLFVFWQNFRLFIFLLQLHN